MKKRILSLLVTLVMAVSVIIGVSIFASADNTDGLKNSAISLAENVTLKMEVAITAPTEGAYAKITLPGGKVDSTQLVATAPKNGDNYVFTAAVAVKDLADDVTVEICNADGTTLVAAATTTALAYCDSYTEGEFLGLVAALKAYATAADVYFDDAKTAENASSADFSAVADKVTVGDLPAGINHRSATLLIESETTIRHYFTLDEGMKIGNYTFFVDANANGKCDNGEKLTPAEKTLSDGSAVYYVDVKGLTPNQLGEVYTVGVVGAADGATYLCEYSALTYFKRVSDGADNKTLNLASAFLAYNSEAAKLTGNITFDANEGSAVAAQTYKYGVNTPIVAPTEKAGYNFAGWFDANGVKYDTVPASFTGDLALKAAWSKVDIFSESFGAKTASFTVGNGLPLYNVVYDANGVKLTNEITVSFDVTPDADGNTYLYFRHVDANGGTFRVIHTYQGKLNDVGYTLSKTEPTNVQLVYNLGSVVANDGIADAVSIDVYVNDEFVNTLNYTLSADISAFNSTKNYFMQIYWANNVTYENTINNFQIKDTSTNKVVYPADATLPEGTATTYTPGTALPLAESATKAGAEFGGWYADAALTKPVSDVPANAVGAFKVYAKWNYYAVNQNFDVDKAGLGVNAGDTGTATVENGVLTWAPSTSGSNQPTITNAGAALSTVVTDGFATYRFELAKAADVPVLGTEIRLCNGASGVVEANLLKIDDMIKADDGTVIAELTTDLTLVEVVVNFNNKSLNYYVDGILVYTMGKSTLNTPDVYNNQPRSMNIRCNNATADADKAIVFGSIAIMGGENISAHSHKDANEDGACDFCPVILDDRCRAHVDANDDGFCDKCTDVAFRDGDEAAKAAEAAGATEFTFPATSKISIGGTTGYGLNNEPHKIVYNNDYKNVLSAIVDISGTDFDTAYFKISQSSKDVNDPWVCFAFVTEMPVQNEPLKYAQGYNTFLFKTEDCAVAIPEDANFIVFYDGKIGQASFYPDAITLKKEATPLDNLQNAGDEVVYEYPMEYLVPSLGVIDYYRNPNDPSKHKFYKDSGAYANCFVAFIDITDCAYDSLLLEVHSRGSSDVGWTFLTELPAVNTVVSYAGEYTTVEWTQTTISVEIPEDAKYLVIYYQDAYSPAEEIFCPESILFFVEE